MTRISNFFFYTGLFTINAFRYNWKAIALTTLVVGTIAALVGRSAWSFIPVFVGVYAGVVWAEYNQFKQENNEH